MRSVTDVKKRNPNNSRRAAFCGALFCCPVKMLDRRGRVWYDTQAVKANALKGGAGMVDTPLDRALLLDFYGELLTQRQRICCDLHWNEDYSLAEIAQLHDMSRQAVWDNLHRAEEKLKRFEEKTGIVRRFLDRRQQIAEVRGQLDALLPKNEQSRRVLARLDELI